jgi:hypothetical protein
MPEWVIVLVTAIVVLVVVLSFLGLLEDVVSDAVQLVFAAIVNTLRFVAFLIMDTLKLAALLIRKLVASKPQP